MFQSLSEKLESAFKHLKGEARITELNIANTVKDIRKALLDADVNFSIAREFTDKVKEKAIGEKVIRSETKCAHHRELAGDVGNEILCSFVVSQVVAEQLLVHGPKVGLGHFSEALEELVRIEELPARCFGQFEAFGRIDFSQRTQNGVAERPFGMAENIKAPDPGKCGKPCEQEKKDGPTEKVVLPAAVPLRSVLNHGVAVSGSRALSRAGGPCMRM